MKNRKMKSYVVITLLITTTIFGFFSAGTVATGINYGAITHIYDFTDCHYSCPFMINWSTDRAIVTSSEHGENLSFVNASSLTLSKGPSQSSGLSSSVNSIFCKYNSTSIVYVNSDGEVAMGDISGDTISFTPKTGFTVADYDPWMVDIELTNNTGGVCVSWLQENCQGCTHYNHFISGYYNGTDFVWGNEVNLNRVPVDETGTHYYSGNYGSICKLDDNEMFVVGKKYNSSYKDETTYTIVIENTTSTVMDSLVLGQSGNSAPKWGYTACTKINDTHVFTVFQGYYPSKIINCCMININASHGITKENVVSIPSAHARYVNAVLTDINEVAVFWIDYYSPYLLHITKFSFNDTDITLTGDYVMASISAKSSSFNGDICKLDTGKISAIFDYSDDKTYVVAAEFVDNAAPIPYTPIPSNNAINVTLPVTLNITVNDTEGDAMDIHWLSNSSGSWVEFGSNSSVGNDTYHQTNSNFSGSLTKYWWSVNVTDGGNWTNATYSFTTTVPSANSDPFPADDAIDVGLHPTLHITVNDSQGDLMNVTFRTNSTGSWNDIATNLSVPNGTYYNDGALFNAYSTKYWWSVNTTDGSTWSNNTYCFTTIANSPPSNSNPVPANADTGTDQNPTLYITVSDPESENMDVYWWTNATGSWVNFHTDSGVSDSTQNAVTTNMDALDTKYWWSVNTTDGTNWDNDTYYFTTTNTSPNPVNSNPVPANGATNQPFNIDTFNITISDPDGDTMAVYLWTNSTGTWTNWKSQTGLSNGTVSFVGSHGPYFTNLDPNTKYYWSANTTDSSGNWDNDTYYFTTNHSYSMTITKTANISTVETNDTVWDTRLVNYTINVTNTGTGDLTDININETWWNCSCSDWKFWFVSTNEPNWETNLTIYNDSCYMSINITNLSAGESYELYILLNVSECAKDTTGTLRNWANVTATYATAKSSYYDIAWGATETLRINYNPFDVSMFDISNTVFAIIGVLMIIGSITLIIGFVTKYRM